MINMRLNDEDFLRVISATPLVSIDLIIENEQQEILLGKRLNRPAKDFWFVPGGRIRKNEPITSAVERVSREELGVAVERSELLGAYDHLYADNFAGRPGVSTHYVVLAYRCRLANGALIKPDEQHSILKWWRPADLVGSAEVHENTKRYFPGGKIDVA